MTKKILPALNLPWLKNLRRQFPATEVFLVGGMVRDLLLRRSCKDIDLVVRNVSLPRLQKFLQTHGRVNLVGKNFGVLKFIGKNGVTADIALPRTEICGGSGAYRDTAAHFDAHLPLAADLARRDFTINAMALDLFSGKIIDPYSGQADLRAKIIRAVGNPAERFQEDYTRLLRGLRFACQLNFNIEPKTAATLKKLLPHLFETNSAGNRKVPPEIIGREFLKSLVANPRRFLELWEKFGALQLVTPELLKMRKCPQPKNYHTEGDVWQHTLLTLEKLQSKEYQKFRRILPPIYAAPKTPSPTAMVAALLHDIAKPLTIKTPKKDGTDRIRFTGHDEQGAVVARAICERLKLSTVENLPVDIETVAWLVGHHLVVVHSDVAILKETTIERYFLRDLNRGRELLSLMFADGEATVPQPRYLSSARHIVAVIARVKKLLRHNKNGRQVIADRLLNGDEIMRAFKLPPGAQIGEMLDCVREAQLTHKIKTKTQALKFLTRAFGK